MQRFTLDSATEFLFGKDVNSLADVLPYPHNVIGNQVDTPSAADAFSMALTRAQSVLAARANIGAIWPLLEIFRDKTEKPMKVVNSYL